MSEAAFINDDLNNPWQDTKTVQNVDGMADEFPGT